MIPELEILLPENLNDALFLLSRCDEFTKIIAGGTDVVTGLRQNSNRFKTTRTLIDINNIQELKKIEHRKDRISIGAAMTFSELIEDEIIKNEFPLLWQAACGIGSVQIRNKATLAGNFVNNAPCADSVPVLLVYNAHIEVESASSKREVSLIEFLNAPYQTKIKSDELVTRVNLKFPPKNLKGLFYKLGRRRGVAISRITLAVLMSISENTISEIRIASGAVTPIGMRFPEIEKYAAGRELTPAFMKELSIRLGERVLKVTGIRWSGEYKLPVLQQMFYQLLNKIAYSGQYDSSGGGSEKV